MSHFSATCIGGPLSLIPVSLSNGAEGLIVYRDGRTLRGRYKRIEMVSPAVLIWTGWQ